MKGFPKHINSKKDLDNLLAMPQFKAQAEAKLKEIAAARYVWEKDKELKDAKDGVTSATAKVITTQNDVGKEVLMQMKLVEDANARFFNLGYKAEDAAVLDAKG